MADRHLMKDAKNLAQLYRKLEGVDLQNGRNNVETASIALK